MRKVVPALAIVAAATIGAGSAAQAAIIDFTFAAIGGTITASPEPLQDATELNLDGTLLEVSTPKPGDASGLVTGDTFSITQPASTPPTDIIFGMTPGALTSDVIKSWTATTGPNTGATFTETLTTVSSIDRSSANAITIELKGTVLGPGFDNTPISLIIDATQSGGTANEISVSGSNSSIVPEPSTWVMLALGFLGLGYAGLRRSARERSALAI